MAKSKIPVSIPILIVLVSAFVIAYNNPFILSAGQDPKQSASFVRMGEITSDGSCTLTYSGPWGERSERVADCSAPINFHTSGETFSFQPEMSSRGILRSTFTFEPKGHCYLLSGNIFDYQKAGMTGSYDESSMMDWVATVNRQGLSDSDDLNTVGCHYLKINRDAFRCGYEYFGLNNIWEGCGPCYTGVTEGTRIVDKSQTFEMIITGGPSGGSRGTGGCGPGETAGGYDVSLRVINPQLFEREAYHRSLIHSYAHYRDIPGDCPAYGTVPEEGRKGYVMVVDPKNSGDLISTRTLRFPLNYFCIDTPVTIVDARGETAGTTVDPYEQICAEPGCEGEVRVPDGQSWLVYYFTEMTSEMNILCDKIYLPPGTDGCPDGRDPVTHEGELKCEIQPVYNAQTGICDAEAAIVITCPGIRDDRTGLCTLPTTDVCKPGEELKINDAGEKECRYYPPSLGDCPDGTIWDPEFIDPTTGELYKDPTTGLPGVCKSLDEEEGFCVSEIDTYSEDLDKCHHKRALEPDCNPFDGEYLGQITVGDEPVGGDVIDDFIGSVTL